MAALGETNRSPAQLVSPGSRIALSTGSQWVDTVCDVGAVCFCRFSRVQLAGIHTGPTGLNSVVTHLQLLSSLAPSGRATEASAPHQSCPIMSTRHAVALHNKPLTAFERLLGFLSVSFRKINMTSRTGGGKKASRVELQNAHHIKCTVKSQDPGFYRWVCCTSTLQS